MLNMRYTLLFQNLVDLAGSERASQTGAFGLSFSLKLIDIDIYTGRNPDRKNCLGSRNEIHAPLIETVFFPQSQKLPNVISFNELSKEKYKRSLLLIYTICNFSTLAAAGVLLRT